MRCSKLTPASPAIGRPRWSISDSSSSMVLFIKDVMLGMRDLITDSKCWRNGISLKQLYDLIINNQRLIQLQVIRGIYLRQEFCKILWTHFTCQVSIIRTCCKILTLFSPSINHINILIDVSLWTVNNSNPRTLQSIRSSFNDLRNESRKTTQERYHE